MKYIITLLIVLTVLVSGCTLQGQFVKNVDSCLSFEGTAKDDCYLEAKKCSKITTQLTRDNCVVELAKIKEDLKVCDLIITENTKLYCYQEIAVVTNNHDLCENIDDKYWKNNCHYNLAINGNNSDYCALIENVEQKNDCYKTIAIATANPILCSFLDGLEGEACIYKIAKKNRNINFCNHLKQNFDQDVCRINIAKLLEDKSKCILVHHNKLRDECLKYFNS